jgi:hypothetical protein
MNEIGHPARGRRLAEEKFDPRLQDLKDPPPRARGMKRLLRLKQLDRTVATAGEQEQISPYRKILRCSFKDDAD